MHIFSGTVKVVCGAVFIAIVWRNSALLSRSSDCSTAAAAVDNTIVCAAAAAVAASGAIAMECRARIPAMRALAEEGLGHVIDNNKIRSGPNQLVEVVLIIVSGNRLPDIREIVLVAIVDLDEEWNVGHVDI